MWRMFFRKNNKLIFLGLIFTLSILVGSNLNLMSFGIHAQVSVDHTSFSFDYIERGSISITSDSELEVFLQLMFFKFLYLKNTHIVIS